MNSLTENQKRYIIILLKQLGLDTESITPAHRALGAPAQAASANDWLDGLSIEEADQLIRRLKAMLRQHPPLFPLICPHCGRPLTHSWA